MGKTVEQFVAECRAKEEAARERFVARCRANKRTMAARREGNCPQCKQPIKVGDTIVSPGEPKRRWPDWYCEDCGGYFQRGIECGYLRRNGPPWLNVAEKVAFEARPDVKAWLEESRRWREKGGW